MCLVLWVGLLAVGAGAMYFWQVGHAGADWLLVIAVGWWLLVAAWLIWGPLQAPALLCGLAGLCAFLPGWYAVMRLFDHPDGPWLFVWLVAIVAAADIGAYFVGKAYGKTKLAPQISPGKTREGLLGGVLASTVVAIVGAVLTGSSVALFLFAGLGLALISVVGDLTVSMFKRTAGLKDSGRILPGHGGVMDRIDSLIAALPLLVLSLAIAGILAAPVPG